ncbi:MAG: GIY-YIG nuclease family protein [FCB group bacterium]|nr:GIY-YIG nuclease family protein [FCB group bacterium]
MRDHYVYILADADRTELYFGMTNNLRRRVEQHKLDAGSGLAEGDKADLLVYYEGYDDIREAIARERELRSLSKIEALALIIRNNPKWRDLTWDLG